MPVVVGRSILRPTQQSLSATVTTTTTTTTAAASGASTTSGGFVSRRASSGLKFSRSSSSESLHARDENTPRSSPASTDSGMWSPDSGLGLNSPLLRPPSSNTTPIEPPTPSPSSSSSSSALFAPASPRSPRKCVHWRDGQGGTLSTETMFRATDEAWRCSPKRHPLFNLTASPPPSRTSPSPLSLSGVHAFSARPRSPLPFQFLHRHQHQHQPQHQHSPSPSPSPRASPTPGHGHAHGHGHGHGGAVAEEHYSFVSTLPGSRDEVLCHLGSHGVQLEHAFVQARQLFLTARVLNICFEKTVFARVTTDHWASFVDVPLQHQPGLSDPRTDAFAGVIDLTGPAQIALCFRAADGVEHWDNNGGANYHVALLAPAPAPASSGYGHGHGHVHSQNALHPGRASPATAA